MSNIGGVGKSGEITTSEVAAPEQGAPAVPDPAAGQGGAPGAVQTARPKSVSMSGLTLKQQLEAKLAAAGAQDTGAAQGAQAATAPAATAEVAAVDPQKVEQDVDTLYKAMHGLGRDKDAILATLDGRSVAERMAISSRFAEKHGDHWVTLRAAIKGELRGKNLQKALELLDKDVPNQRRDENLADKGNSTAVGKGVRRLATWFSFGCANPSIPSDPPRITGADIRKDLIPSLRPGDTILVGNHGGLTHALVYVGDGKIVHSMATEESNQKVLRRVAELGKEPFDQAAIALGKKEKKTGVITEGVDEFFDRIERDTYVVLRDPELTPEKAEQGVARVKGLIGKGYDYDFRPGNDKYYCTEVASEFYRSALGDRAPRIGSRPEHVPLLIDREAIIDPKDVLHSPDLKVALSSKSAELLFAKDLEEKKK